MESPEPEVDREIEFSSHPAHRQDRWVIQEVFKGMRGGYFVEAGASCLGENTYALETHFGWTGLLVEPHPDSFEALKTKRNCILENACLADADTELEFVINHKIPGTSGIQGTIGDYILKNAYGEGAETETVLIKAYPLVDLLRKHGAPKRIDYLSLDVEGAEWLVLKEFPFDEYTFACMTIERGSNDYLRLRAKLLGKGYRLVRVGAADDFWVHPSLGYAASIQDMLNASFRRLIQPIKARLKSSGRPAARS
jgi:FkbM family methyltransferase